MMHAPDCRPRRHRLLTLALAGACGLAQAQTAAEPARPAFYDWNGPVAAAAGTVLRSEPMTFAVDPLQLAPLALQATRILYASTDRSGQRIAVSGSVLVPRAPWWGFGARPLIAVAPGTQGMGDRCAPSRMQSSSFEYENVAISGLLARGYAIVMTDYQGLGTAGTHTYMNRVVQAQAVLDSLRAAQRLPGTGLSATGPVGISGYSQGGGAAAAAAEAWATYAPELKLKGVAIGAPPADLNAVARNLDGSLYTAFELYATAALIDAYGIDASAMLSARGASTLQAIRQSCVFDLMSYAFLDTATLSATGEKLTQTMGRAPFAAIVDEQRIGRVRPQVPVQISHSVFDDVIPFAVGRQLGRDWCARGANVAFRPGVGATHFGGFPEHVAATQLFFEARFAGLPQWSSCGWF